jgi:hypothetical protein
MPNPLPIDLPHALAECPFDLIAKGEGKTVAVKVRTRDNPTLNGPKDLRSMADLVRRFPDWDLNGWLLIPANRINRVSLSVPVIHPVPPELHGYERRDSPQ